MKREINDFWTYDEFLSFFNYISSDLTYAELNLLVRIMQNKIAPTERIRYNGWKGGDGNAAVFRGSPSLGGGADK